MDRDLLFIQTILTDEMVSQGFPLVYKGPLNHQTLRFFTTMAEEKIALRCADLSVKRKVFNAIVEMLQNITKHSADNDANGVGNGLFVIGERKDYYYIITGNMVKSSQVRELEDSIELLNSLDKAALDKMHRDQLQHGEMSSKGGAGLGLIDIIRKTGEKYAYQFHRLNENSHFFILKSTVHFKP